MKRILILLTILSLLLFSTPAYATEEWVSPTGFTDDDADWTNETNAYDGNTVTYTSGGGGSGEYRGYLVLTIGSISCDRIRFYGACEDGLMLDIDIDVFWSGSWHDIYNDTMTYPYSQARWFEESLGGTYDVTQARIRCKAKPGGGAHMRLMEFEFQEITIGAPTVTTSAATNITGTTATLNGDVTDVSGENPTVTVYWGTTDGEQTPGNWDNNSAPSSPSQPQGVAAFYMNVDSLTIGTPYFFTAKATNTGGTSWASTKSFTTHDKPVARTRPASNIAKHSARLNSLLAYDRGNLCRARFGYGTTSQATIAAYDSQTDWTGYIYSTNDHPYEDIDTLLADTTYHFRVEMENVQGTDLGDDYTFVTLAAVDDPTDFRGIPQSTSISLSWTKGDGSTTSMVRFAFDDYPDATDAGTLIYSGTSASYTHTGLTVGTTYYYSVWGISGADESAGYDTVMTTTSAAETAGESLPIPTTPARWLSAPDYTNLENLLIIYPAVNGVADAMEMPRETLWMVLALLGAAAIGIAIYMVSGGKMMLGMIALVLALAFGWAIKIVPFWILLMTIILVVGIKVAHRETQY